MTVDLRDRCHGRVWWYPNSYGSHPCCKIAGHDDEHVCCCGHTWRHEQESA